MKKIPSEDIKANRFYVGSKKALMNAWGHRTLEHAVDHAATIADDHDTEQFVVKIVAIVGRKDTPIVVKKVK